MGSLGNPGYGGVLASVVSVGALVATATYTKWPTQHTPDTIAFITTPILAAAILVLAFAANLALVLLAVFIVGLADGPQLAAVFAVRHREAPEHLRSQVFTTGASLKITAAAIGTTLAGHLATVSLWTTLVIACLVQIIAATIFLFTYRTEGNQTIQQIRKSSEPRMTKIKR